MNGPVGQGRGRTARHRRSRRRGGRKKAMTILGVLKALGVTSLNRSLLLLSVTSFISGIAQAALLVVISEIAVTSVQDHGHLEIAGRHFTVHQALLGGVVLLVIFGVGSLAAMFISSTLSSRALSAARARVVTSFFGTSWDIQSQERLGHIQQLAMGNTDNVAYLTLALAGVIQSTLTVLALLAGAFVVEPLAAGIVIVVGILLSVGLSPFSRLGRKAVTQLARENHDMGTLVTEYTRLTREFRLLGVQREAVGVVLEKNVSAARTFARTRRLALSSPVIYMTLALGFVLAVLAVITSGPHTNLAKTGAVLILILRSLSYGSTIQTFTQQLRSQAGFLDSVIEDVDRYDAGREPGGRSEKPDTFEVVVDAVDYSYDGKNVVLRDVNFGLPDGAILGVVGRSGSGKTTLSQILLGMRQPTAGRATMGGVPVHDIPKGDRQSPVALVAQDSILLQGSIASNIAFFRPCSQEAIEAAARAAHIHDEIVAMPMGYDTPVGEGGGAVSGGQRQRLAIARALLGSPKVLVLDEPTSALDGRSERLIRQTLSELRGQVTVVVISHRLATVEDCDFLLVLERGVLADFGPRDEVLAGTAFRMVTEALGHGSAPVG